MRIGDLKRNDVDGALAYAQAYVAENKTPLPPEEVAMLYRLQDDPTKLAEALSADRSLVERAAKPLRYP